MNSNKSSLLWAIRIVVLILAAAFIMIGLARREQLEVLSKAVTICLECIGIG